MALSSAQRRTVAALSDTMFPSIGPDDPSGGEFLPDALDDFLRTADAKKAKTLGVLLTVFELGAIARHGRPFSSLSPEKRDHYVDGWMRSRLAPRRIIYRALKHALATLYYFDERAWKTLGYDGPLIGRSATATASTNATEAANAKERTA
jgi:hypothetical protein